MFDFLKKRGAGRKETKEGGETKREKKKLMHANPQNETYDRSNTLDLMLDNPPPPHPMSMDIKCIDVQPHKYFVNKKAPGSITWGGEKKLSFL